MRVRSRRRMPIDIGKVRTPNCNVREWYVTVGVTVLKSRVRVTVRVSVRVRVRVRVTVTVKVRVRVCKGSSV